MLLKLFTIVLWVATLATTVRADPNIAVSLTLADDQTVLASFTLDNSEPLQLYKYGTPLDDGSHLAVKQNDLSAKYLGQSHRTTSWDNLPQEAFVTLVPDQPVVQSIIITQLYDVHQGGYFNISSAGSLKVAPLGTTSLLDLSIWYATNHIGTYLAAPAKKRMHRSDVAIAERTTKDDWDHRIDENLQATCYYSRTDCLGSLEDGIDYARRQIVTAMTALKRQNTVDIRRFVRFFASAMPDAFDMIYNRLEKMAKQLPNAGEAPDLSVQPVRYSNYADWRVPDCYGGVYSNHPDPLVVKLVSIVSSKISTNVPADLRTVCSLLRRPPFATE